MARLRGVADAHAARRGVALYGHLGLSPEDFSPYLPSPDVSSEGDLPDAVQKLIREGEENSALLVQHNSETTYRR